MKHYTTPVLEVTFNIPAEVISGVKFLFKQEKSKTAPTVLMKTFPGDVVLENGVYKVPFTQKETSLFAEDKYFYMDTLITDENGHIPETPITSLFMNGSLFSYTEATQ